jgi:glutamate carboxypeptidase
VNSDQILSLIERLVCAESPSGDLAGLSAVAGIVEEVLAEAHVHSVRTDTPAGPVIHATLPGGPRRVLLLAHMDTVWQRGTLKELPFRVDGGRAHGPGIFDMKAGLAFTALALAEMAKQRVRLWTIDALFTPDEEVGSHRSRRYIEGLATGADLVLVLESPMPGGGLKIGRKGTGSFTLRVGGRAAHAGLEPEKGIDAVEELAHQVLRIKGMARPDLGTTVNVGVVGGGTRSNVVAEQAWGEIDVRVADAGEPERIARELASLTPHLDGATVRVDGEWNRPPMVPTPAVERWLDVCRAIWADMGCGSLAAGFVGGASDGNFTAPLAPTLDGFGAVGMGAHARHEHIDVGSLGQRLRLVTDLLKHGPLPTQGPPVGPGALR